MQEVSNHLEMVQQEDGLGKTEHEKAGQMEGVTAATEQHVAGK